MQLKTKCSGCKKKKLWFLVRKRTYTGKNVPSGRVISDTEICADCHDKARILILGQWSLKHKIKYGIMKLTDLLKKHETLTKNTPE